MKKETMYEGEPANKEDTAENEGSGPRFEDFSQGH